VKSVAPERPGSVPTCLRQVILDKMRDEFGPEGHRLPAQTREDALPPEEPSRLEQAIGRDALQRYEAALQRLPDIEREAILARIELRLNDDEVASALDEPSVEAARVTVNRAIVNLALIMTDLC